MVFKECVGLEAARWDEKTKNATHHGGEAMLNGIERTDMNDLLYNEENRK